MLEQAQSWRGNWKEVAGAEKQSGGQGVVLRVKRIDGTELGALKELRSDTPKSSERRQRMKKEVVGLIKAQGAGVPRILESNAETANDNDELFIIMEWIEGLSLQRFVKEPLAIDEALRIARDLALIVSRCHAVDVLHRDIKPDNIIITPDGIVHLVDFGIAWIPKNERPSGDEDTHVDQELGNRFLRLPEMGGGHERADRRSDVTFVVAILFYLLTHKKPSKLNYGGDGAPPHEYMRSRFPTTTTIDPRFGRILSIFDVGFKTYPNQRFPSAAALIARIEEIMTNDQPASHHDAVIQRFDNMMTKHQIESHHHQMIALQKAAQAFEHDTRKLCDERNFEVAMMAGSPIRQNNSWVTTMRFKHKTQSFSAEASHIIRLKENDIYCVSGLKGCVRNYYRGPSSDHRRLIEEVKGEAVALFAAMLESVMQRQGLIDDLFEF